MAKQKIVIKVPMGSERCRSKAMALVAATGGVDSVAIAGDGKDRVVVVGEGVDSVGLTTALRKKMGGAELVEVGEDKKKEEKKPDPVVVAELPWQYYYYPQPPAVVYDQQAAAGYYSPPGSTCSIISLGPNNETNHHLSLRRQLRGASCAPLTILGLGGPPFPARDVRATVPRPPRPRPASSVLKRPPGDCSISLSRAGPLSASRLSSRRSDRSAL
ncbi:hypothetical protein U9M48_022947 [Paspalum notatum var. saurae]|uniref:HMA domain-containing protein n=1 Tax=Paspalum notatum var. saurae TaxID=547442 RepID=A0AAQ3WV81_PASNO